MSGAAGGLSRPHDVEAEQQFLGALMIDAAAAEAAIGLIAADDFAEPLHGRLYAAIAATVKAGERATPVALRADFAGDAAMQAVGGARYLAALAAQAGDCLDAAQWARALARLAFRRALIASGREIQNMAAQAAMEQTPEALAEEAEALLARACGASAPASAERFRAAGEIAAGVAAAVTGAKREGVFCGLAALDELTGGWFPKELIIVGGRPGMGKTAFAGQLALAAASQGRAVAFFSMEMTAQAIVLRLAAANGFAHGRAFSYDAARRHALSEADQAALFEAEARLRQLPIFVHEGRQLTPSGLMLAARRAQRRLKGSPTPLGLVVVDHLQKIRPERDCRGNKTAEMTETSDALTKMAGALEVPVVALSQLNRQSEARAERRPELSDLRESGAIEQDADVVLLLYREAYYVKKREPHPADEAWRDWQAEWLRCRNHLDVHVAKQRNGQEGRVRAFFDGPSSGIR